MILKPKDATLVSEILATLSEDIEEGVLGQFAGIFKDNKVQIDALLKEFEQVKARFTIVSDTPLSAREVSGIQKAIEAVLHTIGKTNASLYIEKREWEAEQP